MELAININDSTQPFTELILSGKKTIDTRDSLNNAIQNLLDKSETDIRVGIVRTGVHDTKVVGYITISKEVIVYTTSEEFHKDDMLHHVEAGSKFDFKTIKYGYRLSNPERVTPFPPKKVGIKISWI